MSEVEILPSNDVLTCLWNKNAAEKCRIGLSDVIIYDSGLPARWYFTGKTGEILKKRAVDINAISNRWKRICSLSNSNMIAIVKQKHGLYKFLAEEAWNAFCKDSATTDFSCLSVHCFIKGSNQTIYRNNFELKDKLGRNRTSTYAYVYSLESDGGLESFGMMNESDCTFNESKASSLKNIMDLATSTVVRYIESMLQIKILKISIDYVVDTKSQLWMLWSSDALFARCSTFGEINVPSFPEGDLTGRRSWLGPKYQEGIVDLIHQEHQAEQAKNSLNKRNSSRGGSRNNISMDMESASVPSPTSRGDNRSRSRSRSPDKHSQSLSQSFTDGELGATTETRDRGGRINSPMSRSRSVQFSPDKNGLETTDNMSVSSYADSTMQNRNTYGGSRGRSRGGMGSRGKQTQGPSFSDKMNPDRSGMKFLESTEMISGVKEHRIMQDQGQSREYNDNFNPHVGGQILGSATKVFDEIANRESGNTKKSILGMGDDAYRLDRSQNHSFKMSNYPNPFKCAGQFCRLCISDVGPLTGNPQGVPHTVEKMFTSKEMNILKKNPELSHYMDFSADGPGQATITMRSVILAAREARDVAHAKADDEEWKKYPLTPRSKHDLSITLRHIEQQFNDDEEASLATAVKERKEQEEAHLKMLAQTKIQRETFTKGQATYYEQVRVCGTCFKVYTLLDWSRNLLGYDDAYGAGKQGKGASGRGAVAGPNRVRMLAEQQDKDHKLSAVSDDWSSSVDSRSRPELGSPSASRGRSRGGSSSRPSRSRQSRDSPGKKGFGAKSKSPTRSPVRSSSMSPSRSASQSPERRRKDRDTVVAARDQKKQTWKDYAYDKKGQPKKDMRQIGDAEFRDVDAYMRGGAYELSKRKKGEKLNKLKDRMAKTIAVEQQNAAIRKQEKKEAKQNEWGEFSDSEDEQDEDDLFAGDADEVAENMYKGKVLLIYENAEEAEEAQVHLEESFFIVNWSKDGRQGMNDFYLAEGNFDAILVQRDAALLDCFAITGKVREYEKRERQKAAAENAAKGIGRQPPTKRRACIVFTKQTTAEDLKLYMKADMDGCVSVPLSKASLMNTIRAAVPHHLAMLALPEPPPDPNAAQVFHMQELGVLEGDTGSATIAAKKMPVSASAMGGDEEYASNGVVQIDADTRVPYMLLDAGRNSKMEVNPRKPFFNLIVCHDLFDTCEKMKIFFKPIVQKYLGMQILVWNYPGQAFTEWREEQLLNNEYHATCLNEVLGQLGEHGTGEFDTTRPFFMLGYGYGTSVSSFYASYYAVPNLRGLISINGWAFIDAYLAGVMHDCGNIFHCAPASRPDLPVYFFSRFLFSKDYLARVSVPLALNIYTAIHNPITVTGRIGLTKGVLGSIDVRPLLREIECPVICIHSTEDSFVRPLHTQPFADNRGGEVRSIFKVLKDPTKTAIIWMKSGHEIFQESKKEIQMLLEQVLTGFHESHDVSFPPASMVDKVSAESGTLLANLPKGQNSALANTVEDKFIDNVLGRLDGVASDLTPAQVEELNKQKYAAGQMKQEDFGADKLVAVQSLSLTSPGGRGGSPSRSMNGLSNTRDMNKTNHEIIFSSTDPGTWQEFSTVLAEGTVLGRMNRDGKPNGKWSKHKDPVTRVFDPTTANFERQDSVTYGPNAVMKKHKDLNPADFPEVKEYMGWRLKRNKKRLQRLQGAARTIQGGYRAYLARNFVKMMRRRNAASKIQRAFRGWIGRCEFLDQARRIWGAAMIQRAYRGYLGRKFYFFLRLRIAAASNIQRLFRGHLGRKRVQMIMHIRHKAACLIQSLYRTFSAKKDAFRKRIERNSGIVIQRLYRGHLGRRKALSERDKYIFSRSQSQGIEFGRQMLLEHKLHATKLQSDVTLLTQEKVSAEEQVEALLEEISSFEEGVRVLEKEMHQLSKVESEAAAFMDEESKMELREQKMRLDKEFGEMLAKIGNRKDMLTDLEYKLQSIDKNRQGKEEELRVLERKLVVLLEEQQNELNAIKRKQDVRGAMLAASHDALSKITTAVPGGNTNAIAVSAETAVVASGGTGMGGGGGPSLQEKKQAAQLMQSTETLMKFGFMSMSMTYFSSLNMIKALRTVSAQDTVMAALADSHAQRAVGADGGGGGGGGVTSSMTTPALKAGQLPGQEALKVSAWSVEDVAKWLQSLSLGQYSEAFLDAAVDGEFLYDLNDDDLRNTLGIEHKLHRKKILSCVHRLKVAEAQADNRINELLKDGPDMLPGQSADDMAAEVFAAGSAAGADLGGPKLPGDTNRVTEDGPKLPLNELFSLVRHSKFSLIKEALDYLPNKKFDKTLVQANYVLDNGTVYSDGYERLPFHINKCDEHGNTMLGLATQNGNQKISKYLIQKGANPNHQNYHGQTPSHFAIAYKFFDLSQYIFENGGDDTLENKYGLTPYDGLSNEDD